MVQHAGHGHASAIIPILILVALAAVLPPYWMIQEAGFSPWLCLLMILPLVNIITLWVIAFSTWKVVPAPRLAGKPQPPYAPPPQSSAPGLSRPASAERERSRCRDW